MTSNEKQQVENGNDLSSALSPRVAWPRERCWGSSVWPGEEMGGEVRTRAAGTSSQVSLLSRRPLGMELDLRSSVRDAANLEQEQQRQSFWFDSFGGGIGATRWAECGGKNDRNETCLIASEDVVEVLLVFGRGHGCSVCVVECRRGVGVGGGSEGRSGSTRHGVQNGTGYVTTDAYPSTSLAPEVRCSAGNR